MALRNLLHFLFYAANFEYKKNKSYVNWNPHLHLAKFIVLLTLEIFGNPEISLKLRDVD